MSETTTADAASPATIALLGKLHEVAKAVNYVEQRGHNKHHDYDYAQAVDVTRTVRDELLSRGVLVIPAAEHAEHITYTAGRGGAGFLTTVDLRYRFTDTETGAFVEVPWVGVGADTGGDKGVYKAYTGGLKYALLNTFLIPTSNDPERDQLTEAQAPAGAEDEKGQKDDERPASPRIPVDRAESILNRAIEVNLASREGEGVKLEAAFKALLMSVGCDDLRISQLNTDQAEDVEKFLGAEVQ